MCLLEGTVADDAQQHRAWCAEHNDDICHSTVVVIPGSDVGVWLVQAEGEPFPSVVVDGDAFPGATR